MAISAAGAQRGGRGASPPAQPAAAVITLKGTVWDSLHASPLRGALVSLPDIQRSATTDSLGAFAIDSVRPGRHTIAIAHEALDSLGLSALTADAMLLTGMPPVKLAIPTYRSFWRAACDRPPPGDSVYLSGVVRGALDDAPIANATVTLVWILGDLKLELDQRLGGLNTTTDENGAYGFCGVPKNAKLRLRAATSAAESGTFEIPEGKADVRWRDLLLGIAGADSATLGNISGAVRQRGSGAPVIDARIVVDQKRETRTDSSGRFTVRGLQPGTRQVAILSVGVAAASATADVRPGKTSSVTLSVDQVQTLASANITTRRPPTPIELGIRDRERMGLGRFVDSTALVGRQLVRSIFESNPTLKVVSTRGMRFVILAKDMSSRDCIANVFIDGVRAFDQDELFDMHPDEIAKVEMYGRGMMVPTEFQVTRTNCGTIVIWTKWKLGTPPQ